MESLSRHLEEWIQRKLAREPFRPSRSHAATAIWQRSLGRRMFGKVTLRVDPAGEFSFVDCAAWPVGASEYSKFVRDGILDALLIDLGVAPGGKFTLEHIEWQGGASAPAAYGAAARDATAELFGQEQLDPKGGNAV